MVLKRIKSVLPFILSLVVFVFGIRYFGNLALIQQDSMAPELSEGDLVWTMRKPFLDFFNQEIEVNSLVFQDSLGRKIPFKILGLPGDTITVKSYDFLRNGVRVEDQNFSLPYRIQFRPELDGEKLLKSKSINIVSAYQKEQYLITCTRAKREELEQLNHAYVYLYKLNEKDFNKVSGSDRIIDYYIPKLGDELPNTGKWKELSELYPSSFQLKDKTIICKENFVFLIANNLFQGIDSREFGVVPEKTISHKIYKVLYNFNRD